MRKTWRTTARGSGLVSSSEGPANLTMDQNRSARLPGGRLANGTGDSSDMVPLPLGARPRKKSASDG